MQPGTLHLKIVKGATFRRTFTWKSPTGVGGALEPKDLTGYTARAQVRLAKRAYLTFDSSDASIVLGDDAGTIQLHAAVADVAKLPTGRGRWSLELQPPSSGDRVVLLLGNVEVLEEVTL